MSETSIEPQTGDAATPRVGAAPAAEPGFALAQRAVHAGDQPIGRLMAQALANPGLISLAAGFVDDATLPVEEVEQLLRPMWTDGEAGRAALQYGTTAGLPALREQVFAHIARQDGVAPDQLAGSPDDVVVTAGSQQLLHLLTDVLVDPGDIVVTAAPSYFVYTGALSSFQADVRTVGMDEDGLRPGDLEALLGALERDGDLDRVKAVYVQSYHQNPTGLTLAAERRPAVLELVRRFSKSHRILLIEDAAYRELTYDGQPPRSIRSFDPTGDYVALLQTFSKPFSPGLKTGYGLLPRDLVAPVLLAKNGRDFGSPNFIQHLLHAALRDGAFDRHVDRLRLAYAVKRDAMLEALDEHLGVLADRGVSWTHPRGGLYVWLTLPADLDAGPDGPLFRGAVERGVLFVPGSFAYADGTGRHTIRLSFGVPDVDQIREGIARLAQVIADQF